MRNLSVWLALVILTVLAAAVYEPTTGFAGGTQATARHNLSQPGSPPEMIPACVPTPAAVQAPAEVPACVPLARLALEQGDRLASDPAQSEQALAHYRACLALEPAGGEPAWFAQARERVQALQARLAPKGTVQSLATKLQAAELASLESIAVSDRSTRAISVGPEGLVYEDEP